MPTLDLQGYFHLPDHPDHRVPGILTFTPTEGGTLNLIGELPQSDRDQSRIIVQTPGNVNIQVPGCVVRSRHAEMIMVLAAAAARLLILPGVRPGGTVA